MKYDELISELRSEICKNNCVDCVYMMTGCTPKLCEQAADAIEELQKEKADLIDKISKLRRKVNRMKSDATWAKDIINGQVQGMW